MVMLIIVVITKMILRKKALDRNVAHVILSSVYCANIEFIFLINLFHATSLFLYSLIKENLQLSDVFKGCRKIPVAWNGLKVVSATFLLVCFACLKESTCETRKN